jgi:hypothetical protein
MAFRDISDPSAVTKAAEEFDDLGRERFLAKYGFKRARQFFLELNGSLYDSKAILGRAHGIQFPDEGDLGWRDFSGGEQTTRKKLTDLGFTVVSNSPKPAAGPAEALPVGDLINWVLELQQSWSNENTPEMQERGQLIRHELPTAIKGLLPEPGSLPFTPDVEGRDATGSKSRVPWVRVFSKTQAPSAMKGWYVVLLFAADGSRAYLSLGTGTSTMESGTFRQQPAEVLQQRITWARARLAVTGVRDLVSDIDLGDAGIRGRQYEKATLVAYRMDAGDELDDETFAERLQYLLTLLSELYSDEASDDEVIAPSDASVVHLLLKWSPSTDPDTVEKHMATADAHDGYVWWGCWTEGSRRVPDHRVQTIRDQIAAGHPTYAYLYRSGPSPAGWRSRIHAITNERTDVDPERVPPYYPPGQHHSVYVLLKDIEPVELSRIRNDLALQSKPIAGSLISGLKTQTSPLYVVDLEPGDTHEPAADLGNPLTREWLLGQTLWSEEEVDALLEVLLGTSPQVILAGPPGTGKSWVAQAMARYLTMDRATHWRIVQFHPSYGYESFMEGLRPVAEDGGISFERVDGTVLRMAKTARLGDLPYVLILDEMNRANIPRVLGELMFLFEYRNQIVDLQYSQGFSLPRNLCFIATMNTADRSIRTIDLALRRRFEIFECAPDPIILEKYYAMGWGENYVADLVPGFQALNDALTTELDRHHTVGQTFFMSEEMSSDRLRRVWSRQIYPLIEEYFFDQPDLARSFELTKFWPSVDA